MANGWAVPFALNTLTYLCLGTWVIVRRKSNVHRLYGLLCVVTSIWQGVWATLFAAASAPWLYLALKCFFSGIVFVPPVFYHFIAEFTGLESRRQWIPRTYAVSVVLAVSVWIDHLFLRGFLPFSWGLSATAGPMHTVFVALVTAVVLRSLFLLHSLPLDPDASTFKRRQMFCAKLATYVYCGGALDVVSQYGISVFPVSVFFSGVAVVLFGYAIFRYEFLEIATPRETEDERMRRQAASAEMTRLSMTAAFPLVSQGELLGYLLLGEKMSEESYSKEDLLLLRIVANQVALAYQRVRYLEMAVHGARTEMLGEIAGGFAHEIKTPLANISLPAELSVLDLNDLEQGRRTLGEVLPELKARMKDIMAQAFKASEKIEAIRQFSKPGQVHLEPVELNKILQGSLGLLDHLLRKYNVKVRTEISTAMSPIRGDHKQLEIVFVNLIKNAAEAMMLNASAALARELSLKGRQDGDWIVISVKDSGPGIKRADFGHLFEAYFTTKGSEGTGMGLFLSHQVIKAHGGSIDVKTEEGRGTEFIIRLPRAASQEHAGVQAA